MKTISAFLIIGSVCLLPVNIPEIRAQQTQSSQSRPFEAGTVSVKDLQSRRLAIENMTDIDPSIKTDSLDYIDQAIRYLALADVSKQKAVELDDLIQAAPGRLKILQARLKEPPAESENVKARVAQMSTSKLEEKLTEKEAELTAAQNSLSQWSDRLKAENASVNQKSERLGSATDRLTEIKSELETLSDVGETDVLNQSRALSLKAERENLSAEIKLIEQQQSSHDLLVELYGAEQEVARMLVKNRENMLKIWQTEVLNRRQQDATRAMEGAQEAMVNVPAMPKIVQDQFDINLQLSAELERITLEEKTLSQKNQAYQSDLKALEEDFETAKKRVEFAVLTEAIGLALRAQRLKLPDTSQYFADSDVRQIRLSEISERQIELDRMLREFPTPKALADSLIGSIIFLSGANRESVSSKIQALATDRLDILRKLKFGYDRIIKLIQDIEFTEQKLVNTAEAFGELLDRHLLWIRSSKPVGIGDIKDLWVSLEWFFDTDSWGQFFEDLGRSFRQKTVVWTIALLVGVVLIGTRRWTRTKLKDIAEHVEQQVEDSFLITIKAMGLTVILAAFWPFMLAIPAIPLEGLRSASAFSKAIAGGLTNTIRVLIFPVLFYNICRKNGLARVHFEWPDSTCQILKSNLQWLIPIVTVSAFLLGVMETASVFEHNDALAKLALMVQMVALSTFVARTLRFKCGITAELLEKQPQSWLCRLRYIWYPAAILAPLATLYLALAGYYYSAIEIRILVRHTIELLLALIVLNHLVLRVLMLTRRKIAYKKAMMAQAQQTEAVSGTDSDPEAAATGDDPPSPMESNIGMSAIDEQTRTLLKLSLYIIAITGLWAIWEPALPALGILQDFQLWSYTTQINGTTQVVPITFASVTLSVFVIIITVVAVRNLPGLLEMILLNRLPMDAGARYAYSAVCRYAIIALGIFIALNSIGIRWSKLQWLIAALGVGLGFGLQEIVANFISGLIVLFERPFRVGDTVTVGDVHGMVTRIRIRATTIEDWDSKELIVPNKEFITGKLINWSLTEKIIRIKIPVGIAYGSDTDLAEQLLLRAARANPLVLHSPEPMAVFLSFGDNSLNFEIRVYIKDIDDWIPMLHSMNRTIDKEFRKAGITIAFPQRDMHLDAAGPLEIRVVSEPAGFKPASGSSAVQKGPDE